MHSPASILKLSAAFMLLALCVSPGCQRTSASSSQKAGQTDSGTKRGTPADTETTTELQATGEKACCEASNAGAEKNNAEAIQIQPSIGGLKLPNVSLVDQEGRVRSFPDELIQNRIVVMNFIFTTCKGICPPMSANFAALQRQLGDRCAREVALLSVSVDPTVDTPERLNAWREQFDGGPGWTLLTGTKQEVEFLLKELEVFSADKNDHSPFILLGDPAADKWHRVHGLTAPEKLVQIITELQAAKEAGRGKTETETASLDQADISSPAHRYFGDVELVNQDGHGMRLYSDLLKGRVVVINSFFATCKGSCPVMMSSFAEIQDQFRDRLGRDLFMISITVDPKTDTPDKLAAYAEGWKAQEGWYFLTGEKANVDIALYKLGQYVENKESHSNIFIIGNEATGLWKKARGLSKAEEIFPLIEEVLRDKQAMDGPRDSSS